MTGDDSLLVERIRSIMKRYKGQSEKKMFGGICFMINGNMCVGPWKGSLIVRLDKADHEATQSEPFVRPMSPPLAAIRSLRPQRLMAPWMCSTS